MTTATKTIRSGYKQTEVGVIPEDWEVKALGSVTTLLTNGFVGKATDFYTESDESVLYIQGYNVEEGSFNLHGIKRVSWKFHAQHQKSCLLAGDLLTIQTGDIGITAVVPPELAGANCHALVISRLDKRLYIPQYYCQYFNSKHGRDAFKEIETGSTMKHLNVGDMKKLFLPSPPRSEQHAIASALSDVDALIVSLDKLIAKKREVKQATMQQLLTGKTRLPGFGEQLKSTYKQTEVGLIPVDWEVHTLGDQLDQLEAGVSVNSVDEEFHIYAHEQAILKTSAVLNGYFFPHENKKIAPRDIKRAKLNPRVDSIIISRMNTIDLVGECGYVDKDYPNLFIPDRLWMTRFKRESKINVKWLSYLLNHKEYKVKIKGAATGTSGSMKNISKSSLVSINIPFPGPEEQQAIATILTDMDAEIGALEQRRDKTLALKQGMMQELLTGKTRLK